MSVTISLQLEEITCCNTECGITWAVPSVWIGRKRKDHSFFYCPNGHSQHFPNESSEEWLRKQLASERAAHDQTRADRAAWRKQAEKAEASAKRARGRVRNGTCPCCKRHFKALAAHMRTKHPEYGKVAKA